MTPPPPSQHAVKRARVSAKLRVHARTGASTSEGVHVRKACTRGAPPHLLQERSLLQFELAAPSPQTVTLYRCSTGTVTSSHSVCLPHPSPLHRSHLLSSSTPLISSSPSFRSLSFFSSNVEISAKGQRFHSNGFLLHLLVLLLHLPLCRRSNDDDADSPDVCGVHARVCVRVKESKGREQLTPASS